MKKYIKPEVKVYRTKVESLLAAESGGQFIEGDAKRHDYFLFPDFVIVSPKSPRQRV